MVVQSEQHDSSWRGGIVGNCARLGARPLLRSSRQRAFSTSATLLRFSSSGRNNSAASSSKSSTLFTRFGAAVSKYMFSLPALDLSRPEDDWNPQSPSPKLYRSASVGNSWGVISIGRGFDWAKENEHIDLHIDTKEPLQHSFDEENLDSDDSYFHTHIGLGIPIPVTSRPSPSIVIPSQNQPVMTQVRSNGEYVFDSPVNSPSISPRFTPSMNHTTPTMHTSISRSPGAPRARRRSSQQRVSLIAGRVSIAPRETPDEPLLLPPSLQRADSTSSLLSKASSTGPPSPATERESFLGRRNISEFVIEGDIGRGAYGLVKRAHEILPDQSLGPSLVIKQVIKSRILADCWKKHPKHGTIPIEIYVMSAVSSTSYVLPRRRPWDPSRASSLGNGSQFESNSNTDDAWVEGRVVKGHPNICPLLEFFEDSHYYYLVLPATVPDTGPDGCRGPSDLFDLIEMHPQGLPPFSIRSYLGQIADALSFLHSRGIVHRDIKDENVVIGAGGRCILIDFGSSGLVKKNGWDTFSGTLDYAGPEILRGERYYGKEQDVWAFGVVAFVLLCGECPFQTAAEAQEGLESPFANASIALDERAADGKELEGREADGGGALGDAAVLVRACLQLEVSARPTIERILQCRFILGEGGWGMEP